MTPGYPVPRAPGATQPALGSGPGAVRNRLGCFAVEPAFGGRAPDRGWVVVQRSLAAAGLRCRQAHWAERASLLTVGEACRQARVGSAGATAGPGSMPAARADPAPSARTTALGGPDKPANGFEPMAFALQKRCSTTELSRQGRTPRPILPVTPGLALGPQGELGAIAAAGLGQQARHMAFDRAWADHQLLGDAAVAVASAEQQQHPLLRWGDRSQGRRHGRAEAELSILVLYGHGAAAAAIQHSQPPSRPAPVKAQRGPTPAAMAVCSCRAAIAPGAERRWAGSGFRGGQRPWLPGPRTRRQSHRALGGHPHRPRPLRCCRSPGAGAGCP